MVFGIRLWEVEFLAYSTWKTKWFFWRTQLRKMKGNAGRLDDGIETNRYTLDSFRYWMVPVLQDSETGKMFRCCSRINVSFV
ncbi:uncharacterized protein OCT59_000985 [Rhizophagus irregularis]|uniref:uncharacterized protein n=1 Tax=Rhizophagus irregularis TaxID=588596 RepID=UPI0019F93E26|nr:hypothetical protein OCT59_000985 [Rhizophagus irregularis]GET60942.1 hypothetical protein RIR_g6815.t1 [Rhizophagus irregularis DAOM 181602=DAOM 197198]